MESDTNSNCSSSHSDQNNDPTKSPRPNDIDVHGSFPGRLESGRHCSGATNISPNHRISSPDSPSQNHSPNKLRNSSPQMNSISNGGCNLELFLQHHRAAVTAYTLAMTKTSTTNLMANSMSRKPHHTIESILGLNNSHIHQQRHQQSLYSHQNHSQHYRESSGK